ncbi:5-deoxy-glucuronate isomerase [Georgenia phoenicis]|uniref:5-deoxy-glucuronate isomerase n=1 Tax=unclassified Georgenia TaxID=2626815 RepID=UPI0039AEAB32
MTTTELLLRAGATAHGRYAVDVTAERAGWRFTGLKVLTLAAGESEEIATGDDEALVLPLRGGCTVEVKGRVVELAGRPDVFAAVTDHLYLPLGTTARVTSADGATLAVPTSRARRRLPVSYQPADRVRTELRGAGQASRQVNNYALANELETDHLLVCEVLTPAGNWSSYPPHKHDEHTADERELEEIYYFEVRPGPGGPGFAFHRTYGTAQRPLELTAEVRSGDVVLTPHGYHGPSMAAPGYDLYYLNVMAGPAEDRAWMMTDDPAHAWVRGTWDAQELDPRLPMTRPVEREARP